MNHNPTQNKTLVREYRATRSPLRFYFEMLQKKCKKVFNAHFIYSIVLMRHLWKKLFTEQLLSNEEDYKRIFKIFLPCFCSNGIRYEKVMNSFSPNMKSSP